MGGIVKIRTSIHRFSAWYRPLSAVLFLAACSAGVTRAAEIELTLQTRDPASGKVVITSEKVDPRHVGVIAVDVWNYHWCKTATMRVDAIVPRMNKALDGTRALGMTVMLCPSDVVDNYVGYPQREAVLALPKIAVPRVMEVSCPPAPDAGGCACGRERCAVNYGWDGMHPGLRIADEDLMPDTQAEVYAICRQRGLTHLIYVGFHTQVCLLGKSMGLKSMKSAGLRCFLARDMTDAHAGYDPARNFTPDLNTQQVVEHFEKYLAPTISFQEELAKVGKWHSGLGGGSGAPRPVGHGHASASFRGTHHRRLDRAVGTGCRDPLHPGRDSSGLPFNALHKTAGRHGHNHPAGGRVQGR